MRNISYYLKLLISVWEKDVITLFFIVRHEIVFDTDNGKK